MPVPLYPVPWFGPAVQVLPSGVGYNSFPWLTVDNDDPPNWHLVLRVGTDHANGGVIYYSRTPGGTAGLVTPTALWDKDDLPGGAGAGTSGLGEAYVLRRPGSDTLVMLVPTETAETPQYYYSTSTDFGVTWGALQGIATPAGFRSDLLWLFFDFIQRPTELLATAYGFEAGETVFTSIMCLRSTDGITWTKRGTTDEHGWIQRRGGSDVAGNETCIIELAQGSSSGGVRLLACVRPLVITRNGLVSVSDDDGVTWTTAVRPASLADAAFLNGPHNWQGARGDSPDGQNALLFGRANRIPALNNVGGAVCWWSLDRNGDLRDVNVDDGPGMFERIHRTQINADGGYCCVATDGTTKRLVTYSGMDTQAPTAAPALLTWELFPPKNVFIRVQHDRQVSGGGVVSGSRRKVPGRRVG